MTPQPAATHTPGPWETSRDAVPDGHTQITVYAEGSGERVATVFQTEANARLIAAAPELFEALEDVVKWAYMCTVGSKEEKSIVRARAALALATPDKE